MGFSIGKALGGVLDGGLDILGGNRAAGKRIEGLDNARRDVRAGIDATNELFKPFSEAGQRGLEGFESGIGRSLEDIIAGIQDNPAFQFQLQQGLDAVKGSAATAGNLRSGNTLKALTEFSQGLASNQIDKEFNRHQTDLDRLFQLTNLGFNANSARANAATGGASALANLSNQAGMVKADRELNRVGGIKNILGGVGGSFSPGQGGQFSQLAQFFGAG